MTCRRCGAPIFWAKTQNGRTMPLDVEPALDGNVALVDRVVGRRRETTAVVLTGASLEADDGVVLYRSHFASCPYADEFRRPR